MPRVLVAYRSVQVTPIMVAPINDLLPTIHAYNFTDRHTIIIMVEKNGNLPEACETYNPRIRSYLGPDSLMSTWKLLLYVFLVLVHTLMSYQQFVVVVCTYPVS